MRLPGSAAINIRETDIFGLYVLERDLSQDERGLFFRVFSKEELAVCGWTKPIESINISRTLKKHTIRGMHFQFPPCAEAKIVTCIRGEVWDVAVDVRMNSPTFLNWYPVILSEENRLSYFIPEGFAHGFQTLTDNSEMLYLHSEKYDKSSEGGIRYSDPAVGIRWPFPPLHISERDNQFENIKNNFQGVII